MIFQFNKSKIFLISCLIFIAGTGMASFLPEDIIRKDLIWFGSFIVFAVVAVIFWQLSPGKLNKTPWRLFFLFLSILFFSIWRYSMALPVSGPDKIWFYNGQTVTARGIMSKQPDIRQTNQKLEIAAQELNELPSRKISGKILVTTNLYPEFSYGDILEITCNLEKPEKIEDFAYDRYLSRFNIYSVCYYPKIKVLKTGAGNYFYEKIFDFKDKINNLIGAGLNEPEASLAGPIILGGQKGLDDDLRTNFQKLGLTHIMAVSGFNISIVSAVIMGFLLSLGLPRRQAFYLATAFLLIYLILVGLPASALRAGLMGFLVLLALNLGRLNKITNSLALTAAILLLINPKMLRDDVGFQLSFLAILGLVYTYPIFDNLLAKIKLPRVLNKIETPINGLKSIFAMTLAAQVFTLPVMAYNFSQISIIAPLSNLLIIWILPFLTIAIIIASLLSLFLANLAFIFFLPAYVCLKYILSMVLLIAKIPYGYVEVNSPAIKWPGWIFLYYLIMIFIVARTGKTDKKLLNQ